MTVTITTVVPGSGSQASSPIFAGHVVTDLTALAGAVNRPPCAIARRVAVFACPTNAFTDIPFDTEDTDNANMINLGADATKITITQSDIYQISWGVKWASNAASVRAHAISINGAADDTMAFEIPAFTGNPRHSGSGLVKLVAGDIVRLNVWQNTGGNLNIQARLGVVRVSSP